MTLDVRRARNETPGVAHVLHFNHAGASLMPRPVLEAVTKHLTREAEIGGYEAADERADAVEGAYDMIARLIGCAAHEVAIVENATRAWDMAFYAIPLGPGDRILTARAEYGSNYLAYLQVARRTGAAVEIIDNDGDGRLSVDALAGMLDEHVRLVSITHVPTNGGLVNPAAEVGQLLTGSDIIYLLDACQSVGQFPVDVAEIGCDLMTATGRKFLRAPRGTGFLYASQTMVERLEPPFLDVRSASWLSACEYRIRNDARRFETWEANHAANIGLGVAAEYAFDWDMKAIAERNRDLARQLRAGLTEIPGARILDLGPDPCAIVSFAVDGWDPDELKQLLGRRRINVSVSRAEDTLLDMTARGVSSCVRASVHYFNTEDEVARLVEELHRAVVGRLL